MIVILICMSIYVRCRDLVPTLQATFRKIQPYVIADIIDVIDSHTAGKLVATFILGEHP